MNKFLIIFLLSISALKAQDTPHQKSIFDKQNEIKIELLKLLSLPMVEVTYEYVKDRNQGFGATLLLNLNSRTKADYQESISLTPFYRMYFDRDEQYGAKGFFVEGFSSFHGGSKMNRLKKNYFDIALGFSIGQKWVNKGGYIFEARLGIGRNLLGNSDEEFLGKGLLYVGYRF